MYVVKYESKRKIKVDKNKSKTYSVDFYGPFYGSMTGELKVDQNNKIEVIVKIEDEIITDLFGTDSLKITEIYNWLYDISSDVVYDSVNAVLLDNGLIEDEVQFLDFKLVDITYIND